MNDIVERLRSSTHSDPCYPSPHPLCIEAADELERFNAENAQLREALEGIMQWNNKLVLALPPEALPALAAARAALAEKEKRR